MSKAEQSTISTLGVCLVLLFALSIVGTLGGLLYKIRARGRVGEPVVAGPAAKNEVAQNAAAESGDGAVMRIASRVVETAEPSAAPVIVVRQEAPAEEVKPAAAPAPSAETPVAEAATTPEPSPAFTARSAAASETKSGKAEMSDELIPEISGPSYTAKKMISSGQDPNAMSKPGAKKPDVKKPVTPPKPPAAPQPPKVEPPKAAAKPAVSALPPLPADGEGKIDFLKAPIYVLTDGRRLRALVAKESDGQIAIRNEVGTLITFKKSDVKEIVRN